MKDNNEIPSFLVPLFLSKQLKRIGFDEKTIFFYSFDNCAKGLRSHSEPYNMNCSQFFEGAYVSLPTWEQVLEWFRKKGFYITLENHQDSTKFMFYNMKINEGKHFKGEFSSYKETREVLVNKLIEVYGKSI